MIRRLFRLLWLALAPLRLKNGKLKPRNRERRVPPSSRGVIGHSCFSSVLSLASLSVADWDIIPSRTGETIMRRLLRTKKSTLFDERRMMSAIAEDSSKGLSAVMNLLLDMLSTELREFHARVLYLSWHS